MLTSKVKYKYEPSHILNLPSVVHNVIPADYNLDGRLDLLILSEAQEQSDGGWWGGSSKNELRITVNLGGGELGGFSAY
jgi:integrin alpha FG-GAP repeat containing protein 1